MIPLKARRIVLVLALALTAGLSFIPLADASAARGHTARTAPSGFSLLLLIQAQAASLWEAVEAAFWDEDSGVRMDPNGKS